MVKYCFFCGRRIDCKYEKSSIKYCLTCARVKAKLTTRWCQLMKDLYGIDLSKTTLTSSKNENGVTFKVEVKQNETNNNDNRQG